jgi:hypothetical protein
MLGELLALTKSEYLLAVNRPFRHTRHTGSSGVQEFRGSGVQEFRSSGVQEFRSSGVQEFRVAQIAKLQAAKQP